MALDIIVPVSGGLESTYLLQQAMTRKADITVVFINVCGVGQGCVGELLSMNKTLEFFRSKDLDKTKYPGKIVEVIYYLAKPYLNIVNRGAPVFQDLQNRQTNNINQQISVVMALAKVRSSIVAKSLGQKSPTTVIGWLHEDSSDLSLDDYDFSEAEYQDLLNLPVTLGRLSNADRLAVPFRAPLWKMTKQQVWAQLDPALEPFVIPNGWGKYEEENSWIVHTPHDYKKEEYEEAGIPLKDEYVLEIKDDALGFFVKRLLGMVTWKDLDLPQEARSLINQVNEQPIILYLENFIYEERLTNLKGNFKYAVQSLHEAAAKFAWPIRTTEELEKSSDVRLSYADEEIGKQASEDRPTVSVALRQNVVERFLGDRDA